MTSVNVPADWYKLAPSRALRRNICITGSRCAMLSGSKSRDCRAIFSQCNITNSRSARPSGVAAGSGSVLTSARASSPPSASIALRWKAPRPNGVEHLDEAKRKPRVGSMARLMLWRKVYSMNTALRALRWNPTPKPRGNAAGGVDPAEIPASLGASALGSFRRRVGETGP
jgi:hypothetical protein